MQSFNGREWNQLTSEEKREAEQESRRHFMTLKQSAEPTFMISKIRKSWHAEVLHDILGHGRVDCNKKIRVVLNYDPEYPLIDFDVFELT